MSTVKGERLLKTSSSQQSLASDKYQYPNNFGQELPVNSLAKNLILGQEKGVLQNIENIQNSLGAQKGQDGRPLGLRQILSTDSFQDVRQYLTAFQYSQITYKPDQKISSFMTQFMENVHVLIGILNQVSPSSLNRLEIVSKNFYQAVVEGQLWRKQCEDISPNFKSLFKDVDITDLKEELKEKLGNEYDDKKLRHLLFKRLHWQMCSHSPRETLISESIGSTSQDKQSEAAYHTIHRESQLISQSYWCSQGYNKQQLRDSLQFRLGHPLCLIRKISLQPFKAHWQHEQPIYNPKKVQFKFGGQALYNKVGVPKFKEVNNGFIKDNQHDVETEEMEVEKIDALQTFRVDNIVCSGGFFQLDVIDSTQQQEDDGRYYVGLQHVKLTGLPLLNFIITDGANETKRLQYIRRDLFNYVGGYYNVLGCGWTSMLVMAKLREIIQSSSMSLRRSVSFTATYKGGSLLPSKYQKDEQPFLHDLYRYYKISSQDKQDFEALFMVLTACMKKVVERASFVQDRTYLQNQIWQIQNYRDIPESCKLSVDLYVCQLLQTQLNDNNAIF